MTPETSFSTESAEIGHPQVEVRTSAQDNVCRQKLSKLCDLRASLHLSSHHASCLLAHNSHLNRVRTPKSRKGRGGRRLGEPRLSMSAIIGLFRPVSASAARMPPKVPLVTPTAFWQTADQILGATWPNAGAALRDRQTKPLQVCSIPTASSPGKR